MIRYVSEVLNLFASQGKQISATVSQAFELAYRKYQEAKDIQTQFMDLKKKLKNAPPEEKEKVKKEIAALEAKSLAEEERLQRAREQIKSEAAERGLQPPAPRKTPSKPATIKETVVEVAVEKPKQEPPVSQLIINSTLPNTLISTTCRPHPAFNIFVHSSTYSHLPSLNQSNNLPSKLLKNQHPSSQL